MLDLDQADNLARLYRLFIKVPDGLATVKKALKDSILRRGMALNVSGDDCDADGYEEDLNEPDMKGKGKAKLRPPSNVDIATKWVEAVLGLKDKFDSIWRTAFLHDRSIETSYNEVSWSSAFRLFSI